MTVSSDSVHDSRPYRQAGVVERRAQTANEIWMRHIKICAICATEGLIRCQRQLELYALADRMDRRAEETA